jgi:hypothetical protein
MTDLRQDEAVPFHAAEGTRWMSIAHAVVVAFVLGAAAGAIPTSVLLLARAKGLVTWL